MPFGYEPDLLAEQQRHNVGIFNCNESAVFSNMSSLANGKPSPVQVHIVDTSLTVSYGGRWMTALNTPVFNKLWMEVVRLNRYRYHDWTVKVDPDSVFFPGRLRTLMRHHNETRNVHLEVPVPANLGNCGMCKLPGHEQETCASHVRWVQKDGRSCSEAVRLTARLPPHDCGCECDDFSCELPEAAMYLNNCKWGLHGPIEVLSRRTVAVFAAGLPRCVEMLKKPWGEDKFLDQCLQALQVKRVDVFSLLSEIACGDQPAPCGKHDVAFHPFKSIQSYFTCHAYASRYGEGPYDAPHAASEDKVNSNWVDERDRFVFQPQEG